MDERGLDACFFGREANARYVSGVRRLWTAQTRPFVPACLVVGGTEPIVELLAFSASYEDIPEEVGPDHFFPVTWNPMNMIERFRAIPGVLDARRIGFDGLSPLFEGMLRQALPDAEFVGVEDDDARVAPRQAARRDHLPAHRGRGRRVVAATPRSVRSAPASRSTTCRRPSSTACASSVPRSSPSRARSPCIDPGARVPVDDERPRPARGRRGGPRRRRALGGVRGFARPHVVCAATTRRRPPSNGRRTRAGARSWTRSSITCRPGRTGADLRAAFEQARAAGTRR